MKGSQMAKAVKEIVAAAPTLDGQALAIRKTYLGEMAVGWDTAGLPAALVMRVAGVPGDADRRPRFRIDVWAEGLSASEDAMEAIRDHLVYAELSSGCSTHGTAFGVVDDVEAEAEPVNIGYSHATIRQMSQTFRVTTRTL